MISGAFCFFLLFSLSLFTFTTVVVFKERTKPIYIGSAPNYHFRLQFLRPGPSHRERNLLDLANCPSKMCFFSPRISIHTSNPCNGFASWCRWNCPSLRRVTRHPDLGGTCPTFAGMVPLSRIRAVLSRLRSTHSAQFQRSSRDHGTNKPQPAARGQPVPAGYKWRPLA